MKKEFDVKGMTCSACSATIERELLKKNGVKKVEVNLLLNKMNIEYDENIINPNIINKEVKKLGYKSKLENEKDNSNNDLLEEQNYIKKRIIISFIFLILLMYIAMGPMLKLKLPKFLEGDSNILINAFTQLLLLIPIIYMNRSYFDRGLKTLIKRNPNMDSLIAIGSLSAIIYGLFSLYMIFYGYGRNDMNLVHKYFHDLYFESAGTILTLITFGKYLEAKSKKKTTDAITKLLDLTPKKALILKDNKEVEINIDDVKLDDIIIVKPGMTIPVDGIIIEGKTSVDQQAITGESIPVEKNINDKVIAATINKNGYIRVKTSAVKENTLISKIVKLVEQAQISKAPIAKLADKISYYFVPSVIIISIISFIFWLFYKDFVTALSTGISVLVISCPCALGLATPVSIIVSTGLGASNGILIKSAEALELLHKIDTVVLDKTGTLTTGKPTLQKILTYNNFSKEELLVKTYSLERLSEHPLSESIIEYSIKNNIKYENVLNFESLTGKGIKGIINNDIYYIGNLKILDDLKISNKDIISEYNNLSKDGQTPLIIIKNELIVGIISVSDTLKESSIKAVEEFKKLNLKVIMLTGDNKLVAESYKDKLKLDKIISDVYPDQKDQIIKDLQNQNKKVLMVGDGINDAVSLVRADVGMAIGAGTDIAIESADIVLINNNLLDVIKAINLSKKTIINIKENLFWAFIYNIVCIPIASGLFRFVGLSLNPMIAALAMAFSSIFVVTNALRLKLINLKGEEK